MDIETLEQFIEDFENTDLCNTKISFLDFYPHGNSWEDNPFVEMGCFDTKTVIEWQGGCFSSQPTTIRMEEKDCFTIHEFERLLEGIDALGYPESGLDSCLRLKNGNLTAEDWEGNYRFILNEEVDRVIVKCL